MSRTSEIETNEITYPPEFTELFQTGRKLRQKFKQPDNPHNMVIHILAVVDDIHPVFKHWSREKQRWVYEVSDFHYFWLLWRDGYLKAV